MAGCLNGWWNIVSGCACESVFRILPYILTCNAGRVIKLDEVGLGEVGKVTDLWLVLFNPGVYLLKKQTKKPLFNTCCTCKYILLSVVMSSFSSEYQHRAWNHIKKVKNVLFMIKGINGNTIKTDKFWVPQKR